MIRLLIRFPSLLFQACFSKPAFPSLLFQACFSKPATLTVAGFFIAPVH
ncbi:MAG: hypothetical protein ACI97B_001566 [Verrucomicrobiales bacterium]|jgi:hypothetical protein